MMHYHLTLQEHEAARGGYVDPDRYREGHRDYMPEMLCRTGDGHAKGTRDIQAVTCDVCIAELQKRLARAPASTDQLIHTVHRLAMQHGPGGWFSNLAQHPTRKTFGHQHYFFDSEAEARAFMDSQPRVRHEYSLRAWGEPFLTNCIIDDRRAKK